MQVFLIRHAQTHGNLERRFIGRTDEPLSEAAVAGFCNLAYPAANRVVVSPLLRCRQTARILYPMEEPVVDAGLRECDFGDFEGKSHRELENDPRYREWVDRGGEAAPPNGESMDAFKTRCRAAFAREMDLAFSDEVHSIAFVIHGGTIMAVMERFGGGGGAFYDWQVENLGGWASEVSLHGWVETQTLPNPKRLRMEG